MLERDIGEFSKIRYQARAYMCFLFNRNIPNKLPLFNIDTAIKGLEKIQIEIKNFSALYILSADGIQVIDNISKNPKSRTGKSENRSHRAYHYRAVKEKKCILTDPYPCAITGELTVTASYPIYNQKGQLQFIACIDITMKELLKVIRPEGMNIVFEHFNKVVYSAFALGLFIVATLLFSRGVVHIMDFRSIKIEGIFEATILLTLSLAIFDLVKAIFEEEVLGKHNSKTAAFEIHKTMTKFLGSIIIALAIESLMLVFKFAITGPEKIVYAVYLIGGVTMLLFGLTFYIKTTLKGRAKVDSNS